MPAAWEPDAMLAAQRCLNRPLWDGMQQALTYAEMMGVPSVYSSNGDGFLEHDRSGQQRRPEHELSMDSPDFFDLIVVDECHRGSADANSAWREILEYFSSASQIGLTATPKETTDISTTHYFGDPVFVYSLKQGIEDGFLAPYRRGTFAALDVPHENLLAADKVKVAQISVSPQ
jgi:type I site-specific restriction endonuclease